jgi:hypothetical protein
MVRLILCLQQTGDIDNLIVSWGKVLGCVVYRFHVAAGTKLRPKRGAIYKLSGAITKLASINLRKLVLSPTGSINLGFILREDLLLCSSYLPLGVPNWADIYTPSSNISSAVAGEKEDFCQGSLSLSIFYFVIVLLYFIFSRIFLSKIQKISSFIVVILACLLLVLLEWVLLRTPSCVILLAPITMILSALLLRHLLLRQIFMRLNLLC